MILFDTHDPIVDLLGTWASELTLASILLRVAITVFFAAVIGCERANKRHAAGLRTFMLVSLTGCFSMLIDTYAITYFNSPFVFVSAAAVIGTAIISANSILYSSKNQIKGLTTSVGLWACAVVGITAGAGLYSISIVGFIALLCCLSLFPRLEALLKKRSGHFEIHLELVNRQSLPDFTAAVRALGLRIDDIEANPAYVNSGISVYTVSFTVVGKELKKYKKHDEIIAALASPEYVRYVEEIV